MTSTGTLEGELVVDLVRHQEAANCRGYPAPSHRCLPGLGQGLAEIPSGARG